MSTPGTPDDAERNPPTVAPAELTVPRPDRQQDRRPSDALRAFGRRHRVPLLATLPTLPLYAVWWAFLATGGGDLAAQEAWADFASRHGSSAYGLFWYGGMHTVNYSVVSPYLMALAGVRTVTVVSGLAASWLAAVLVVRCGVRRPVWPALLASLALWCDVAWAGPPSRSASPSRWRPACRWCGSGGCGSPPGTRRSPPWHHRWPGCSWPSWGPRSCSYGTGGAPSCCSYPRPPSSG
ncbi:hypothetical protein STENM36S_07805 [Streptomyces tendae]